MRSFAPDPDGLRLEAPPAAIVVLGCRAVLDAGGRLAPGALARRVEAAARLYSLRAPEGPLVVASGGRRWGGVVEADVVASELVARGVPASRIIRERCSLSTRDNARFVAEVLARRGAKTAVIVTCAWHMPRALALFSRAGLDARPVAAGTGAQRAPCSERLWRWGREAVLSWAEGLPPGGRRRAARAQQGRVASLP